MKYILLHKNIQVLKFEVKDDFHHLHIEDVYDENHIPIGLVDKKNKNIDDTKFSSWWKNRTIPSDRKNLEIALNLLKVHSKEELLNKTHCLNVTDHYWTQKENENLLWENVNFFDNKFDDSVGEFLLLKKERTFSQDSLNTPDLFTDGLLPKKWIYKQDGIYLLKGTDSTFQQEPFNEAVATYICQKLNIPHVKYDISVLENDNGEKDYFSLCKNFVTKDSEFITAYDIINTNKRLNHESIYQHFIRCCNSLGIKNFEEDLDKILCLDFIMANIDRHFRNFGFLRNPDTLEWQGLAPVFDTEKSLFLKKFTPKKTYPHIDIPAKPFKDNHAEQFNLLIKNNFLSLDFSKLKDLNTWVDNLLKNNIYISDERRDVIVSLLNNRVAAANYLITNDQKIQITKSKQKRQLDNLYSISIVY